MDIGSAEVVCINKVVATEREFGSSNYNPIVSVFLQARDYSRKVMLRGHLGKSLYKIVAIS